ncbi:MAG: DUF3108 domain-containing protein [Opitutaceae bacterium]|nr:DUF3108 domain-containing protein [Opitutaceae bacterium]
MRPFAAAWFIVVFGCAALHAGGPFTALRDGERFRFQISWGIFSNAGEIVLQAGRETTGGTDRMRITTRISSRGFVRGFYRFDNQSELVVDMATGRLLSADEVGTGSKDTRTRTVFDYGRRTAVHTDFLHADRNREFALGAADPVDLITALIQTREWIPKPGDHRSVDVYFGRDLYPVVIRAEQLEKVKTPLGIFNTVQLTPRMETEPPRGVFKRGGEIKVWVSASDNPQPVQMQLKLGFGTARLVLAEHALPAQENVREAHR